VSLQIPVQFWLVFVDCIPLMLGCSCNSFMHICVLFVLGLYPSLKLRDMEPLRTTSR
jgi:hypothetical protein